MAAGYGLTCFQWFTLAVPGVIWGYLGLLGHRMGTTLGTTKNVIERNHAPVAQMDRVRASGARGRGFESHRARHFSITPQPPRRRRLGLDFARRPHFGDFSEDSMTHAASEHSGPNSRCARRSPLCRRWP